MSCLIGVHRRGEVDNDATLGCQADPLEGVADYRPTPVTCYAEQSEVDGRAYYFTSCPTEGWSGRAEHVPVCAYKYHEEARADDHL